MNAHRLPAPRALLVSLATVLTLASCAQPATDARWEVAAGAGGSPVAGETAPGAPSGGEGSPATGGDGAAGGPAGNRAPGGSFAVGTRQVSLSRGAERPLPTTVWYPASGPARSGADTPSVKAGAPVAAGRFPLVLFSHGLTAVPANYQGLTARLAAAGFVVAAPAYPNTKGGAARYNPVDVINQPADAWYVIGELLKLADRRDDLLAGHLDRARVGAAGHSAGGFTTAGMLAAERGAALGGAVIISGGSMGAFTGPSTPVLFVHGDQDPTVSYSSGHTAYDAVTWPKAFLTLVGVGHGELMAPGQPGFDAAVTAITDFLRWSLYGDAAAKDRIAKGTPGNGAVRTEARLG